MAFNMNVKKIIYSMINPAILTFLVICAQEIHAFTHWLIDEENQICHGYWHTTYPETQEWNDPNFFIELDQQHFNLKEKIMNAKNLSLVGRGMVLEAKGSSLHYEKDKMFWSLEGDVKFQTASIFIEADEVSFSQNNLSLVADNVHFVLLPQQLHGYAKHFQGTPDSFELSDVIYTQCPPDMNIWSIQSQRISYEAEPGLLVIERPELTAYESTILRGPTIRILKNKVTNRMVTIPNIKIASQGSLSVRMPMLFNQEHQSVEVIPELNFKYGPGLQTKLFKGPVFVNTFAQLFKFTKDPLSWFMSIQSQEKKQDMIYHYQGSLVSDQDLVYRYPDLTPNVDMLYAVSRASLKKETSLGILQLYTEKLYRYQEARESNFEVIENLAHARLFDYQPKYLYQISGDIFYRYGDKAYSRFLAKSTIFSKHALLFNIMLESYPSENFHKACFDGKWRSEPKLFSTRLTGTLLLMGKIAASSGISPLLDTVAMPMHEESLDTLNWHHGSDWVSDGVVIGPRLQWIIAQDLLLKTAINYAVKKPIKPWISATQPYLTSFSGDYRFSPLSISLSFKERFLLSTMIDLVAQKYVYGQLDYSYQLKNAQGYLSILYHHYYPKDTLSYSTEKVTQLNWGYYTQTKDPWQFFIETGVNLIPIKIERFRIGWKYDHCCWESSLGFNCQKSFNPLTQLPKWNYAVTLKAEVRALGFMQLGRDKTLQYLGIQWNNFNKVNDLYRPGYY
jgi:hypothetical protein